MKTQFETVQKLWPMCTFSSKQVTGEGQGQSSNFFFACVGSPCQKEPTCQIWRLHLKGFKTYEQCQSCPTNKQTNWQPGSIAQLDACSTGDQEVVSSRLQSGTILFYGHSLPSSDSRREVVSYLRMNVHWVLVNRLIGLILSWKCVVRLTDRANMTLAVDHGR